MPDPPRRSADLGKGGYAPAIRPRITVGVPGKRAGFDAAQSAEVPYASGSGGSRPRAWPQELP